MRGRVYRAGVALSLIFSVAMITLLVGQQPALNHLLNALTQNWSEAARLIVSTVVGYLLGAIPFGFIIVGFLRERDITAEGSGRTGGTNAMRAAGFGAGALTVVGDVAKGIAAVYAARELAPGMVWAEIVAGWGAVLGHNASIFLMFRGGAGSGRRAGCSHQHSRDHRLSCGRDAGDGGRFSGPRGAGQ